jgi:hypothetical protein
VSKHVEINLKTRRIAMKSIKERIIKGRDFAYGISQPVDIDLAYEMWDGYEEFLAPEDLDTFNIIKSVLFGEERREASSAQVNPDYAKLLEEWGGALFSYGHDSPSLHSERIASRTASYTGSDVEELFRSVLKLAKEKDKVSVLYTALKRCERSMTEVKEITEENRNFGNNVGYFINTIFGSLSYFMEYLDKQKADMSYPPKKLSKASIYMVVGGRNKMSEWNLLALIELGEMKAKKRFARKLEVQDFDRSYEDFKNLILRRA